MLSTVFRFRFLALLIGLVYLTSVVYFQRWNTTVVHGGDSWGYYGYLPAAFIYHDLDDISDSYLKRFDYAGGHPAFPTPGGELPVAENGHRVIKYTCGVAVLQAPFFAIGHTWARISDKYEPDGFSFPYIISVILGNLVYLFVGLFFLYRLLSSLFKPKIACWVLLLVALGSNLFNFAVYRAGMSHAYLFSLYAGLMYATWRFYQHPQRKWIIMAALCAGLITLIRPVEILCLAIPLAYGLVSTAAVRERLNLWRDKWPWLILAAVIFILCGIPQLLYWKYASGHWLFDSYPGEAFDFAHSRIANGLFSTRNGWLVYAPIMAFSLAGIIALFRKRNWLWPVLLILPLHVWIAYSWWCWYYINGFGSRPMVELHALLCIPLAYSVAYLDRRNWSRYLMIITSIAAIALQLFQNWQHSKGILWSEMAAPAYYQTVFGQTEMTYDALVAFDTDEKQPDSTLLDFQRELVKLEFEQADTTRDRVEQPVFSGQAAWRVSPEKKFGEFFNAKMKDYELAPEDWLRVSVWCYKDKKEFPWYTAPSIVVEVSREGKITKYRQVRIDSKLNNPGFSLWGGEAKHWGWVRQWVRLPKDLQGEDRLKIYVIAEQEDVYLDEVSVEIWR